MHDDTSRLCEAVIEAAATKRPMRIIGAGSKTFLYSGDATAPLLEISDHTGVIEYRPEELVVTVRAGTPLSELRYVIGAQGQMWACDPPEFGGHGTVGGAIASGWCGPGRPWYGTVRDSLLGIELINGSGERLRFGGKVIKNVAGFDVSRLLAGSKGSLGVILSASLKLLPRPEHTRTAAKSCSSQESSEVIASFARKTSTLTGTCYFDDTLYLRFAGEKPAVDGDMKEFASHEEVDPKFWIEIRDQSHPFFVDDQPLWRVSLPRGTESLEPLPNTEYLAEWNGCLVWYKTPTPIKPILNLKPCMMQSFRNIEHETMLFSKYAARLKHAFDPRRIFNPGVVV